MTRLHEAGRAGGHADGASPPTAPRARRTPRGSRSRSRRTSPHETELPNINLLHLTSRKAIEAAMLMARRLPAHRLPPRGHRRPPARRLRHRARPRRQGQPAAAPARGRRGAVGARARRQHRLGRLRPRLLQGRDEVRRARGTTCSLAKSGFGGAEYLLAGMVSEGRKRGLSYNRIAELTLQPRPPLRPARPRARIAVGYDADFCLVDHGGRLDGACRGLASRPRSTRRSRASS